MNKCLTVITVALLAASAATLAADSTHVFIDTTDVHYNGILTQQANETAFKLFNDNSSAKWLVITSRGGEVHLGLDLAEFIVKHKLNVKVTDYCLSSCANYVFPAGTMKVLAKHAVVGFHGGASSTKFDLSGIDEMVATLPPSQQEAVRTATMQQINAYIKTQGDREVAFYNAIGVQQAITTLGQTEEYENLHADDNYVGWYYTPEDMQSLGLNNIEILNAPWEFKQPSEKSKMFRVKLQDSR